MEYLFGISIKAKATFKFQTTRSLLITHHLGYDQDRLEAFSDGVFTITLLVLDIRLPEKEPRSIKKGLLALLFCILLYRFFCRRPKKKMSLLRTRYIHPLL